MKLFVVLSTAALALVACGGNAADNDVTVPSLAATTTYMATTTVAETRKVVITPEELARLGPTAGYFADHAAGTSGEYEVVGDRPMAELAPDLPWLKGFVGGVERTFSLKFVNDADPMTAHDATMFVRVVLFDSASDAAASVFDYRASIADISSASGPFASPSRLENGIAMLYDEYTLPGESLPRVWEGSARRGRVWVWAQMRNRSNMSMTSLLVWAAYDHIGVVLEKYPDLAN